MNRYTWRTGIREAIMIAVGLVFAFPVYILVNLSLSPLSDSISPLAPARQITLANFSAAWHQGALGSALINSTIIAVCSIALIIATSAFAAYPLARLTSRLSRAVFYLIMVGLLLPFIIALIPLYKTMHDLGLLGTVFSLIILYTGLQFPFSVFLYTSFLRTVPLDYEEAAMLDGCGPVRAFVQIVFPMLRPVTGTVVVLNAILIWNDFLTPLLFLGGSTTQTLPVALYGFVGQYTSDWPTIFAGVVISIIPVLAIYFALQRWFMRGFATGLKG